MYREINIFNIFKWFVWFFKLYACYGAGSSLWCSVGDIFYSNLKKEYFPLKENCQVCQKSKQQEIAKNKKNLFVAFSY